MLAELISSRRILKAQLIEFLGLPDNSKDKKESLVSTILSILEENAFEQARFWETFKSELAVEPIELEELLQCSKSERKRWVKEGKLPILEYRSFRKSGMALEYPVHDRRFILSLTPADIQQWREEHRSQIKTNRQTGAQIASESRKEHEQSREAFSSAWEKIIEEWQEKGSAEISAILQLAYWTVWASRWAKENQLKSLRAIKYNEQYEQQREQWYQRKNQAIQLLAQVPYGILAFYRPVDADKLYLKLCDNHYEMMKEGYYWDKWEFYYHNRKLVHKCRECIYTETRDYYSLYYLEIKTEQFPDFTFSYHTPYTMGKKFLPHPETLPYVDHVEQDGIFRFGRPMLEQEKIIHREKDVLVKFEKALAEAKKFV
ncbi:hypothetical protein [Kamptonema sp. UHCC 0994]|uniref:hypothetical protein n=1 Tax=Kamptonema sp. UHCC 0994 TaxID=3031329 RepID=UPI0023B97926|nr:hypothetical protein [Kamptonema sp. UHCC 0994]MDF0555709.1 hypothetical protein [Kamptonema sp. UHCC 0994]